MSKLTELIETNNSNNTINPTNPHHIAIQFPENTCFNCLQNTQVHKIRIPALGQGSKFKFFSTRLNLCLECLKQTNSNWWKLEIIENKEDWYELHYKYEKEILEFINQMPLSGQELFYARFGSGANSDLMRGQDWINYALGKLSHEKCNQYGYYSPEEIKAYQERFPLCDKIKSIIYENEEFKEYNIFKLRCPFGAEDNQINYQCYECRLFIERNGEIEIMNIDDFEIYELQIKLRLKILLKELKNRKE